MKLYVTHSSSFDFKTELYDPIKNSELFQLHEIVLPHDASMAQFNSKEYLKKCDLVIAEVSYPSVGQGIELGWADLYQVPIVCLYKKGASYSGALKVVSNTFLEYGTAVELISQISLYLEQHFVDKSS